MASSAPADPPRSVALFAADGRLLSLARRLPARGIPVTLLEADAHDAARRRAMLTRAGIELPVLTPADPCPAADILVAGAAEGLEAAAAALPGALLVRTDGADPGLSLILHATTGAPALAELVARAVPEADAARVAALAEAAGVPVVRTGGIGGRLRAALMAAADNALQAGAVPAEVDAAMAAFGFAIGPYELEDLIGLDRGHAARVARGGFFRGLAEHAAAEGRLGKMAGVGWYRYPGGGGAVEDPLVEDLLDVERHLAGATAAEVSGEDIAGRLTAALVDAGARAVAAGLGDAGAVDRIAVAGLGFPADRGGPLAWCDAVGAAAVLRWLDDPAPLLLEMAAAGGRFTPRPSRAAAPG
jgi:3-hydroxyacyl-CoA dehydrogenase